MSASIVCPACGAMNLSANVFCTNCGVRLAAPTVAAPPTWVAPQTGSSGAPSTPPLYPAPGTPYPYFPPPLRRASASNILSGMFDVWTKNFLNFFIVFLTLAIVNGLIGALLAFAIFGVFGVGSGIVPGTLVGFAPASFGLILLFLVASSVAGAVIGSIVTGGMTEYSVRRFRGEALTVERALRRGLDRFLSILGANILLSLLLFALVFAPLALLLSGAYLLGGTSDPGTAIALLCGGAIGLLVGAIVGIYVSVGMSLYAPAIMMENHRAVDGLMRSWRMTRGHRVSIFGAILVEVILVIIVTAAISVPASFVANPIASLAATALASGLVGSLPVILAAIAYDLIARQSSFGVSPFFPGPTIAPPTGAGQMPQPPTGMPPPPGP